MVKRGGPAERARKCFAVAKSQDKFPAEREAAIRRGMAILDAAGLDPDHFDIPGRERKAGIRYGDPRFADPGFHQRFFGDAMDELRIFTFDDLVRAAVRESLRKRHGRVWEGYGVHEAPPPDQCPHGRDPRTTYCFDCEEVAEQVAGRRCRHGREQCPICGELDGFGRI